MSVRTFETGATRDIEDGKYDYEGFLSPLVLERFAAYMHQHRIQSDGSLRASDNWQKGIPRTAYMKSAWRHFIDWWTTHRRTWAPPDDNYVDAGQDAVLEDALCALLFNVQGYLHEHLKSKRTQSAVPPHDRKDCPGYCWQHVAEGWRTT